MRILAGEARSRVLQAPGGHGTRPTDSRSREMLFNVLGELVVGARFLDCYAGSGAVGLEALSRGAAYCTFIEQDHAAVRAIRANIAMLKWGDRSLVWNGNVKGALNKLVQNGESFDIVFGDPPFAHPTETLDFCQRVDNAPSLLMDRGPTLLDNEHIGEPGLEPKVEGRVAERRSAGLLIIQHHRRFQPGAMKHYVLWREKRAGESSLSFFLPLGAGEGQAEPEAEQ